MNEIVIGKARIVHVEEVILPAKGDLPEKSVVASKLQVSSVNVNKDPRMVEQGHMVVPVQLPFGRNFFIVLREDDGTVPAPQGRQFKEE